MSHTPVRVQDKQSPYVDYFRGNGSRTASRLFEPNSHPHVGVYRHSPARTTSNGLQEILRDKRTSLKPKSVISTLQLFNSCSLPRHLEKKTLERMPTSHFISNRDHCGEPDGQTPMCPICLEHFIDGDEIRNLKCSHCFHKSCVDIWLLGTMSSDVTTTVCPTCRQDASSEMSNEETGRSIYSAPPCDPAPISPIPVECFLRVGQFLLHEESRSSIVPSPNSNSNFSPRNLHHQAIERASPSQRSASTGPPPLPPIAASRSPPLPPLMSLPPPVTAADHHLPNNTRSPTTAAFILNSSHPSNTTLHSTSSIDYTSSNSLSTDSTIQENTMFFPALDDSATLNMDIEEDEINYQILVNNNGEEEEVEGMNYSFVAIDIRDDSSHKEREQ